MQPCHAQLARQLCVEGGYDVGGELPATNQREGDNDFGTDETRGDIHHAFVPNDLRYAVRNGRLYIYFKNPTENVT